MKPRAVSQRKPALFQDTEYKKQTITKLESELVRANEDLASYQKEIKAGSQISALGGLKKPVQALVCVLSATVANPWRFFGNTTRGCSGTRTCRSHCTEKQHLENSSAAAQLCEHCMS